MSSVFGCGELEVPFTIRGAMEGRRAEEGGGGRETGRQGINKALGRILSGFLGMKRDKQMNSIYGDSQVFVLLS